MSKLELITQGVHVAPFLWALQSNPGLWNQNTSRTKDETSPHHGLSDIWARFAAPGVDGSQPHESVWYPSADLLPVRELVYPLMAAVKGVQLGGVLITRIPAGAECRPHKDPGWHARYYDKFAIQIQSAPGQAFCFEDERLESKPGDVYLFRNEFEHWVSNDTLHDRITLICCIRTEETVQRYP